MKIGTQPGESWVDCIILRERVTEFCHVSVGDGPFAVTLPKVSRRPQCSSFY